MAQRSGYDAVAAAYAERFNDELGDKPFDTKMLDWLAERSCAVGTICDMGCGPGQVAAHLHALGCDVCGVDLSAEMVRHAQRINPGISFDQGDMTDLAAIADAAYGGVVASYSIVNLDRDTLPTAFREFHRVLETGGWLLVSFHIGNESTHLDEFLGVKVSLDFYFFDPELVRSTLSSVGLDVTEVIEREPYDETIEAQTKRAYIFARKV